MERGLFYLPCGNRVDDMPPSFEGWYNPQQSGTGGTHHSSTKRHLTRFVPTTATLKLIIKKT